MKTDAASTNASIVRGQTLWLYSDEAMKKVAIIGGGIAGLATAYYLRARERGRDAIDYTLIESAPLYWLVCLYQPSQVTARLGHFA